MKSERPAALSVSLPRALRKFVDQRVRGGGFGNVSEYIRTLIRADQGGALPLAVAALPGLAPRSERRDEPAGLAADDAPEGVTSLSSGDWRELRDALLRGGQILRQQRLVDAAGLFRSALVQVAAQLRHAQPAATKDEVDAALAAWLHQEEVWDHDGHFRPAPGRLRGILGG